MGLVKELVAEREGLYAVGSACGSLALRRTRGVLIPLMGLVKDLVAEREGLPFLLSLLSC